MDKTDSFIFYCFLMNCLSPWHCSIKLFSLFEPFESVDVGAVLHREKTKEMNRLTQDDVRRNFDSVNDERSAG